MAFISLILTAQSLIKLKKALEEEKLESIKASEDVHVKKKFKFSHIGVDIKETVKNFFKKLFRCSESAPCYKTCYKLGHEGSCENYTLKSILGFFGGVFLTYFCYILFIFQLNVKLTSATWICSFLGCILTVGLAFSSKVRCVVLLTLPQFFSKRGRQAFLAYAFVLALTGPAQNTLNNLGILSESLACGQEQLKQAVRQIIDVIKKPFLAIKEAIKKVIKTVKEVIKKIKEILLKIKRVIMALVRVIKSVFEFIGRIINICNKELGTPFERCSRVFENAIADCNAKLGPLFNWLCSLTYIVKAVCYIVKIFDYVCMIVDFISNSVVGVIIKKVKNFVRHIKTMFYVRIKFSHSFKFQTVASKSIKDIAKEIVAEIKDRSKGVVAFFNIMTSASMMFFIWLIFQVAYYRIKYMTSEKFDNIYITHYFREIDQRRAKVGKETVLPLTKKEKTIYVPMSGSSLARSEKRSLKKAATTLATASVKLATHMAADYSLYWILTLISKHARYQSKVQAPNLPMAHITGEGFLAKLLRSIVNAFQPVGIQLEIDTVPCLPIPIPPDLDRYAQIGVTIVLCWILTLLEPYGLRLRNYIMGYYHPIRAKQRTIWLYNHILRSRISFLLMARRNFRKKFGMKGGSDEVGCKDWLRSRLPCAIFKICLGDAPLTCMLCGEIYRESKKKQFKKCHTPNCPGLFCLECFADLNNICPICLKPIDYGDIDDIDEEKDSSGDEAPKKKKRWCSCLPCCKPKNDDEEPFVDQTEEEQADGSDTSTDYSHGYQYDDGHDGLSPAESPWRDVEKQAIPDEASMESFREGEEQTVTLDNQILLPKGKAALVRLGVTLEEVEEEEVVVDYGPYPTSSCICNARSSKDQETETDPLLANVCACSQTLTPRRVEFIGLPLDLDEVHRHKNLPNDFPCICSDSDNTGVLKSTMSTSPKSDCKYCKCENYEIRSHVSVGTDTEEELRDVVPPLDLSFLQKEDEKCSCDNPVLSSRFSYVTYQEINETPKALSSSLESSSVISALENPPSLSSEDASPVLRNRKIRRSEKFILAKSVNSAESYELSKAQNRKVRDYYEATKGQTTFETTRVKPKRRSISDMFKNLLPQRKKDPEYLPLYQTDIPEEIEIRSYNYNEENWNTLSPNTDSPTYPFATQRSQETSDEEQQLLGGSRIRGGECQGKISKRNRSTRGVKPFDAKSRARLKDFTTLSLPPKPKPANSKELFTHYFGNASNPIPTGVELQSMNSANPSGTKKESRIVEDLNSSASLDERPASESFSSESTLSESVCKQLFGDPPEGVCQRRCAEDTKQTSKIKGLEENEEDREEEESEKLDEREEDQQSEEEAEAQPSEKSQANGYSQESIVSAVQLKETHSSRLSSRSKGSKASVRSKVPSDISEASSQKVPLKTESTQHQLLYKDDKTEISLVQKLDSDKSSRPEIAIPVRSGPPIKLKISLNNTIIPVEEAEDIAMKSPKSQDKITETNDSFPLHWSPSDGRNGKLIISNDKRVQTSDNDIYKSSEVPVKGLENKCCLPQPRSAAAFYSNDLPERDSSCKRSNCKSCLSTPTGSHSDNRYAVTSGVSTSHNEVACKNITCNCTICRSNKESRSTQDYSTSRPYVSPQEPASSCRFTEATLPYNVTSRPTPCGCCNCNSPRVPSPPTFHDPYFYARNPFYNTPAFPPVTTSLEMQEYLPPPPPPPPRMPLRRLARPRPPQGGRCVEQCTCGMAQSHEAYGEQYDYSNRGSSNTADLPYQNNEEYLELVQELQDTLHTRTSNRVKKAREAFENRSKQNKPLEKPVINYDETDESEEPIMRRIDQLRTDRKMCCAKEKCGCKKNSYPPRRSSDSERSSSWMMDPGSGEWHRNGKQSRRRRQEEQEDECECNCTCECHC
ncbi:uncharacterized protein LOC126742959 isoform X2 [Anthonomus grandis grandis]|uniref:uncharacterized protein LOC126742959 isoform X2 n=1 Tax=Anthonomus grandis grandis TaxID=2921223 RepID=UPI0021659B7E|nr:uncharacterized protein LOC126742959 isoform X2 [Anthonomus grandis grandis]